MVLLRSLFFVGIFLLVLLQATITLGHPIPDVTVRGYFNSDGKAEIRVEVDPRCYAEDPEALEYLLKNQIETLAEASQQEIRSKVAEFTDQRLKFFFNPGGEKKPEFIWEYRQIGDLPWETPDAKTVLVGSWKFKLSDEKTYQVKSLNLNEKSYGIPLNVVFVNFLNGVQAARYSVLFPGETSFELDLINGYPQTSTGDQSGIKADSSDWLLIFNWVVVPALIMMALAGIWWVIKRILRRDSPKP